MVIADNTASIRQRESWKSILLGRRSNDDDDTEEAVVARIKGDRDCRDDRYHEKYVDWRLIFLFMCG